MVAFRTCVIVVLTTLVLGCGGSSGSDSGPTTGTLTIGLTDAPVDLVDKVHVKFSGITLKPQNGPALEFAMKSDEGVDLLTLQDGSVFPMLESETVDAGRYNWIELHVNAEIDETIDSYVMTENGEMIELEVPSGTVRLVSGFVVTAGKNNEVVLDWDVRKGLTDPVGKDYYTLTPALRLIDMTQYGSLSGTVADALIMDESCTSDAEGDGNLVYVYKGSDVTADDLGSFGEPVTTAPVSSNPEKAGAYTYIVHFLDPGEYTVAFTCQGLDDDPATDAGSGEGVEAVPSIDFAGQVNASVADGDGTVNEAPLIE
jgi:hypothetical protein